MEEQALSFDDVMLSPKFSTVRSRGDVSLEVELSKGLSLKFPVFPANMKSVAGDVMAYKFYKLGGLFVYHRFMDDSEIVMKSKRFNEQNNDILNHIGFSVGIKDSDYNLVDSLVENGVKIICIDVAHGHSTGCQLMTQYIASRYPSVFLIAGNVATYEGALMLWQAGADAVKVNIGAGSTCSTRVETGNGVPMVTALLETKRAKDKFQADTDKKCFIISDGACRHVGDLCKALCLSDLVMTGNMFAGTDETPEELVEIDGVKFKKYSGSSTHKTNRVEGVSAYIPYKGSIDNIVKRMVEGIQSCCSYQGVHSVVDLQINPKFVKLTHAGLMESHPHDLGKIIG